MSSFVTQVFDAPMVFVDIETNGLNHVRGRVIEVAAIRVEHGRISDSFTTLVDPGVPLPAFITSKMCIRDRRIPSALLPAPFIC